MDVFGYIEIASHISAIVAVYLVVHFGNKQKINELNKIIVIIEEFNLNLPLVKSIFSYFDGAEKIDQKLKNIHKLEREYKKYVEFDGTTQNNREIFTKFLTTTRKDEPLGQLFLRISDNETLFRRFRKFRKTKNFLRNSFANHYKMSEILKKNKSIFIESGSTLSYISLAILEYTKNNQEITRVCTNNIIVYMLLLFEESIEPKLLPGFPNNAYGATFGDRKNGDLCDANEVRRFLYDNHVTALFTTASFISARYGPHVSSSPNHNIKRTLSDYSIQNDIENILIISAEKVQEANEVSDFNRDCKLIFDPEGKNIEEAFRNDLRRKKIKDSWEKFIKNKNSKIFLGSEDSETTKNADKILNNAIHGLHSYLVDSDEEGCYSLIEYVN